MINEQPWKITGIEPLVVLTRELLGYLDQAPAKIWNSNWGLITVKEAKFSKHHQEIDDTHAPCIREIYNLATVFNRDELTSVHPVILDAVEPLLSKFLAIEGYSLRGTAQRAEPIKPKDIMIGRTRSLLGISNFSFQGSISTIEMDQLIKSMSLMGDDAFKVQAAEALELTINEKMSWRGQVPFIPILN